MKKAQIRISYTTTLGQPVRTWVTVDQEVRDSETGAVFISIPDSARAAFGGHSDLVLPFRHGVLEFTSKAIKAFGFDHSKGHTKHGYASLSLAEMTNALESRRAKLKKSKSLDKARVQLRLRVVNFLISHRAAWHYAVAEQDKIVALHISDEGGKHALNLYRTTTVARKVDHRESGEASQRQEVLPFGAEENKHPDVVKEEPVDSTRQFVEQAIRYIDGVPYGPSPMRRILGVINLGKSVRDNLRTYGEKEATVVDMCTPIDLSKLEDILKDVIVLEDVFTRLEAEHLDLPAKNTWTDLHYAEIGLFPLYVKHIFYKTDVGGRVRRDEIAALRQMLESRISLEGARLRTVKLAKETEEA